MADSLLGWRFGSWGQPHDLPQPPAEGAPQRAGVPPNTASLAKQFHQELELIPIDVVRRFRGINGYVKPLREESDGWETED
jgi:sulfhydrogenase subunit delta